MEKVKVYLDEVLPNLVKEGKDTFVLYDEKGSVIATLGKAGAHEYLDMISSFYNKEADIVDSEF